MEQRNEFIDRVTETQLNAIFSDVNEHRDRLASSRLARTGAEERRSAKVQERAIRVLKVTAVAAGVATAALLLSRASNNEQPEQKEPVSGESIGIEVPAINPEACDFSTNVNHIDIDMSCS